MCNVAQGDSFIQGFNSAQKGLGEDLVTDCKLNKCQAELSGVIYNNDNWPLGMGSVTLYTMEEPIWYNANSRKTDPPLSLITLRFYY